jgi:hypothetical protein
MVSSKMRTFQYDTEIENDIHALNGEHFNRTTRIENGKQ